MLLRSYKRMINALQVYIQRSTTAQLVDSMDLISCLQFMRHSYVSVLSQDRC